MSEQVSISVQQPILTVSVITVTLDGASLIRQTIDSVLEQTYPHVEYIIIDGGSTDGTVDIVREYDRHLAYWSSEADSGIAEAMNKGIARSSGELVLFLHSDDYLARPDSIEKAVLEIDDLSCIWAFSILFSTNMTQLLKRPRPFDFWSNFKVPVYHQGVLMPREVIERVIRNAPASMGSLPRQTRSVSPLLFDVRFRIAMDYEFWLRCKRLGISLRRSRLAITVMRDTGISSRRDSQSLKKRFAEEKFAHELNASSVLWKLLYELYWVLYPQYRRLRAGLFRL